MNGPTLENQGPTPDIKVNRPFNSPFQVLSVKTDVI